MNMSQKPKIIGIFLMLLGLSMLTPVVVNSIYSERYAKPFFESFLITFIFGLLLWFIGRKSTRSISSRDGFIIVALVWSIVAIFGSIPYIIFPKLHLSFSQAVFESASGFTTTGATVIQGLDSLPHSILYYRQQTQFLGGMGIIVLTVAILPLLGSGGMQLYKAEATGYKKDEKLAPKISSTAKVLWLVYLLITFLCIICYMLAGMGPFDAICYAFSTVANGGFAPSDASMENKSPAVLVVCIVFLFLSATSFKSHYIALSKFNIKHYAKDSEFKAYFYFLFFVSLITAITLVSYQKDTTNIGHTILNAVFQVVSISSSAGFISDSNYYLWPSFLPVLLMFVAIIGGCGSSTAGGLKMIRAMIFKEKVLLEAKRVIHPQGVFVIRLGGINISEQTLNRVSGFIAAYILLFAIAWLVLLSFGLDIPTSFSAVATTLSNSGPGLGAIGVNFKSLPNEALWLCDFTMVAGRLEIFTILILFMPEFWKK